jgi:hypothetical protein
MLDALRTLALATDNADLLALVEEAEAGNREAIFECHMYLKGGR